MPGRVKEEPERIRYCTGNWCNKKKQSLAQLKISLGAETIADRVPGLEQYQGQDLGPIWAALKAPRFIKVLFPNLGGPRWIDPNPIDPSPPLPSTVDSHPHYRTRTNSGEDIQMNISLSIKTRSNNKENNITSINDAASIKDGKKKASPAQVPDQHVEGIDPSPQVRYVESVTTTKVVGGTVTEVKVHKPYADACLGIKTFDSQKGEVEITGFEDGSPMGPLLEGPLEEGMTIIAVDNEEITSSEKFVKVYDKCSVPGDVVIKVGPKKMSEAVKIMEDYEEKSEYLEKENRKLGRDNKELEEKNQQLDRDNKVLEKENQLLKEKLEKERSDASQFRRKARVLELTRCDFD